MKKNNIKNAKSSNVKRSQNYQMSSHKEFCGKCYAHNGEICPDTKSKFKSLYCTL